MLKSDVKKMFCERHHCGRNKITGMLNILIWNAICDVTCSKRTSYLHCMNKILHSGLRIFSIVFPAQIHTIIMMLSSLQLLNNKSYSKLQKTELFKSLKNCSSNLFVTRLRNSVFKLIYGANHGD